jgi:hypothetical protein
MKRTIAVNATLMATAVFLWAGEAVCHEHYQGGSTTHSFGSTSHENPYGGSSEHQMGVGTEHTNQYGGSTSHTYGGGTEHTNPYGGSTSGEYGEGATHTYSNGASVYHPPGYAGYPGYPAYHPPVAVPYYSQGCYGCAAAAGAVAGAAVGVAVGAAAASANAAPAYAAPAYAMGTNYATLPPGSTPVSQGGTTYYVNGSIWFLPAYGANGVYYRVVPAP